MNILIINGPNLNLLGSREPTIYGTQTFDTFLTALQGDYPQVNLIYYQSNHEGGIIDTLQQYRTSVDGIVINAGAYTHTSVAIADCIRSLAVPVIEVHISNIFAREEYRHHSFLSPVCAGTICGLGLIGYKLAIDAILYDHR